MKNYKENEIKPQGFFVNLDWDEAIQELDDVEAGQMFKNMFHYLLERELLETSRVVTMISKMTVFPTLEYNVEKYQKMVERNRKNGKTGGRKKDLGINPEEPSETQKNPVGYSGYPDVAKDKAKEKSKEKDKVIVKEIDTDIDNENAKEKEKDASIDTEPEYKKEYKEKFQKLVKLNVDEIKDQDARNFCVSVKELVERLGWNKFIQIVLDTRVENVGAIIKSFQIEDEEFSISQIRRNYYYFFKKMN